MDLYLSHSLHSFVNFSFGYIPWIHSVFTVNNLRCYITEMIPEGGLGNYTVIAV